MLGREISFGCETLACKILGKSALTCKVAAQVSIYSPSREEFGHRWVTAGPCAPRFWGQDQKGQKLGSLGVHFGNFWGRGPLGVHFDRFCSEFHVTQILGHVREAIGASKSNSTGKNASKSNSTGKSASKSNGVEAPVKFERPKVPYPSA